jgi:hypothetical protein
MPASESARELLRVIRKHVRGDGSESGGYTEARQWLIEDVGRERLPPCVQRNATLARCNAYLREIAGNAVQKRLDLLAREFAPLLKTEAPKPETPQPAAAPAPAAPVVDIFISHSSHDVALATAMIDLLRAALGLAREAIRCTSVPGYQLAGGAEVDAVIRREAVCSRLFIALVTPASLRSPYVLFELGARWGILSERALIPIVAGMDAERVPRPLASLNLIDASNREKLHHFVDEVGRILKAEVRRAVEYVGKLEETARLATAAPSKVGEHEQRLIRALFGEKDGRNLGRYLKDSSYEKAIGKLLEKGLAERRKDSYFLTEKGKQLARELFEIG